MGKMPFGQLGIFWLQYPGLPQGQIGIRAHSSAHQSTQINDMQPEQPPAIRLDDLYVACDVKSKIGGKCPSYPQWKYKQ